MLLATPLVWLNRILHPVIVALNWTANLVLRAFKVEPQDEVNSTYTLEEVQSIVAESTRTGLVDDGSGLISGALEFSDYTAESVMVRVSDVVTLPADVTPRAFEKAVGRTGFSRFVLEDSDGSHTGYLHLKDVMTVPGERYREPVPVTKVRSLANVAASDEIEDALSLMQRTGSHVARVISAAGETVGVLFLEDVLEVLVGEIHDATQSNNPVKLRTPEGRA